MEETDITNLRSYLEKVDFPASRDQILEAVRNSDASEEIQGIVAGIPDKQYESADEVMEECTNISEEGTGMAQAEE
jgi:hypothetical protein